MPTARPASSLAALWALSLPLSLCRPHSHRWPIVWRRPPPFGPIHHGAGGTFRARASAPQLPQWPPGPANNRRPAPVHWRPPKALLPQTVPTGATHSHRLRGAHLRQPAARPPVTSGAMGVHTAPTVPAHLASLGPSNLGHQVGPRRPVGSELESCVFVCACGSLILFPSQQGRCVAAPRRWAPSEAQFPAQRHKWAAQPSATAHQGERPGQAAERIRVSNKLVSLRFGAPGALINIPRRASGRQGARDLQRHELPPERRSVLPASSAGKLGGRSLAAQQTRYCIHWRRAGRRDEDRRRGVARICRRHSAGALLISISGGRHLAHLAAAGGNQVPGRIRLRIGPASRDRGWLSFWQIFATYLTLRPKKLAQSCARRRNRCSCLESAMRSSLEK